MAETKLEKAYRLVEDLKGKVDRMGEYVQHYDEGHIKKSGQSLLFDKDRLKADFNALVVEVKQVANELEDL